jgi:hypothetical protein
MSIPLSDHIANLRAAILEIKATGPDGFEGLMAAVLAEIGGVPFRLASSGSQFGIDGKAAFSSDGVSFECKRYKDDIPRTEILSKVAEIAIQNGTGTDLWVLCATVPVSTQLVDSARSLAECRGVAVVALDWPTNGLPPLATALASARTASGRYLRDHVADKAIGNLGLQALIAISEATEFSASAERIAQELKTASLGLGLARSSNKKLLQAVFSDKKEARSVLGQSLCPGRSPKTELADRKTLVNTICPYLSEKPDGRIVAILGEEGVGKSWSIAMSWLALTEPPLTIFYSADEFTAWTPTEDDDKRLIDKLIAQTSDSLSDIPTKRWRRRLKLWREAAVPSTPRIVVVIDGLNQRPSIDWGRLIERFASILVKIGGRLVLTSRTTFFTNRIKASLLWELAEIPVSPFSEVERNGILQACGVNLEDVKGPIAETLNNPRLLGIAIALLKSSQIDGLNEINVSRLLFEYIRAGERENSLPRPAHEFANGLQQRARDVRKRLQDNQNDDLTVFDQNLVAASEGRFFKQVPGAPLLYRLEEDGLTLALALAVIDELKKAERNQRDVSDVLAAFIEPIEQLDRTAAVLIAAVIVASLNDDCSRAVTGALVSAFSQTQNPDASEFPAFASAAKRRSDAFMDAAKALCLSGHRQPNFDWVHAALAQATNDTKSWKIISEHLKEWLARYSLNPERRIFNHRSANSPDNIEMEKRKVTDEINSKITALSTPEKTLVEKLCRCDQAGLSGLQRLAFVLLAGKPLVEYAPAFAQWSFSNALHSDHGAPTSEFVFLVRLNRIDWTATREAILREAVQFEGESVSQVGKWAYVRMLNATGHPDDADKARAIAAVLTKDRPRFPAWRRVENYCATDPCEPVSAAPENIGVTSGNYATIDVSKLREGLGTSSEDHFFSMARPGIVRFDPDVAVRKHRELIAQVIEREEHSLRYGMFELTAHRALVTRETALRLLTRLGERSSINPLGDAADRDRWIVSQYHLLLAFPHLTATEQIDALLAQTPKDGFLLELMDVAKPLNDDELTPRLDRACVDQDEEAQVAIIAFARASATSIGAHTRTLLADLTKSPSASVRAQVFAWIAGARDQHLAQTVAASDWRANAGDEARSHEAWYGSFALLQAAKSGLIDHDLALDRISPRLYGRAAVICAQEVAHNVARRIDASIRRVAGLDLDNRGLELSSLTLPSDVDEPSRLHASERRDDLGDPATVFRVATETEDAFEKRQQRIKTSFERFKADLSREKASIVLDNFSMAEFDAIAASDKSSAGAWYELLLGVPEDRRSWICNIGMLLAHAFSSWDPDKAATLFSAYGKIRPAVRFIFGYSSSPLGSLALWSAKDHVKLDELRYWALDTAATDNQIAEQVIACLKGGKFALLRRYIESRLSTGQPAEIARALMVAGFSDDAPGNREVLLKHKETPGFIGRASAAAIYAFERNAWARHWFERMRNASSPEEFWRHSVLLSKVVDGRIDTWATEHPQGNEVFSLFWPSVRDEIKRRCEKWRNSRDGKLFGDTAPAKVFVAIP